MTRSIVFMLSIAVQLVSGEELKCRMVPLETEDGFVGYCCVFPKATYKEQFLQNAKSDSPLPLPAIRGFRDKYPPGTENVNYRLHGTSRLYPESPFPGMAHIFKERESDNIRTNPSSNLEVPKEEESVSRETSENPKSNSPQTFGGIFQYPYPDSSVDELEKNSTSNEITTTETVEMTTINLDNRNNIDAQKTCLQGYKKTKQGQCKPKF